MRNRDSLIVIALIVFALHTAMPFEVWLDARAGLPKKQYPSALFDREINAASTEKSMHVTAEGRLMEGTTLLGAALDVESPNAQEDAIALVGSCSWIFVANARQPMILSENILAAAQGSPTQLAVTASLASQVNGLAFALQIGVGAVVVASAAIDAQGEEMLDALQIAKAQRLERTGPEVETSGSPESQMVGLSIGRISAVVAGGVGDRVCLDLTRLLEEGEGALIGSSAKRLALVLGETAMSGYVPPRPFRINAGPVHSYVLLADGSTKYLSEVGAGDEIMAVRASDGQYRACAVGRCKIEPRPLLRIDFTDEEGTASGQLFLQQAETVRLATPSASTGNQAESLHVTALPVTKARAGQQILLRSVAQGTHVGKAISAQVTER